MNQTSQDIMKIVLATCGTRGDVQPILALALALKDAGHEVLLAAPPENEAWVAHYDCPFHALGSNVEAILEDCPNAHTVKPASTFLRFVRQELKTQFSQLPSIIRGADLVLGASLASGLRSVSESLDVPYGFIALTPQLLPSSHYPFLSAKKHDMPHWLNRLSWEMAKGIDNFNLKPLINRERRHLGLIPIHDAWSHILGDHVIVASDPSLGRVPPDVRQTYTQTGYFHLRQREVLDRKIEAFLSSGPPPLYAGFGSMPSQDMRAMTPLILDAARSGGHRIIISRPWANGGRPSNDPDCCFISNTPHNLLFPHVAAVVHHGGAGTTATAAKAGVPQIIVPHMLDQYYWANRVHQSGLGTKPIRRSRLNRRRLAKAVEKCLSDAAMRHRAKEISELIHARDSLGKVVRLIESAFVS
jgi:UDP:flavonoid glycosyltransferase YjiC (YdhE family)